MKRPRTSQYQPHPSHLPPPISIKIKEEILDLKVEQNDTKTSKDEETKKRLRKDSVDSNCSSKKAKTDDISVNCTVCDKQLPTKALYE